MAKFLRLFAVVAVLAATTVFAGCGDSSKPAVVQVKGKVTYKKTTMAVGALVVFHPVDDALEKRIGGKPFGKVNEDGTFQLTSYNEADGAPEGDYGVTIQWEAKAKEGKISLSGEGAPAGRSMINEAKYGNPQRPFTKVSVKKGEVNEFVFDVE